jgi:O-antigen ligase
MQLWVLLITALVPLAMTPGLVSAFDITPKIAILLFCESVLLLFCKQLVNGTHALLESPVGKLLLACLTALWLSMALSTLYSTRPILSITGSSWRRDGLITESALLFFAFTSAAWFAEDQRRIRSVLRTATATGVVASLYGLAQYFGWDPFLPSKAYQSGEGIFTIVRPPGTFGHADYFANWLLMAMFFALALRAVEDDKRWRTAADLAIVLATFAIVLSGTRSAMLGLFIGAIVFVAIARPRLDRNVVLIMTGGIACLGLLYVSPAGEKLRARVHWSLDDVRGGARLLLWKDSIRMAIHRPLFGYGLETFTEQFPPFESVELSRAYPDFYQESPHNMFLDALTSRGLPGALLLLSLCVLALWAARKNAALAAGLTGAIVCQQFVVLTVPTAVYFYLLIAMLFGGTAQPVAPRRFPRVLVPLTAAIAIVFLIFAARLIIADHSMALAERRIEAGDAPGAAAAYRAVQRWAPAGDAGDLRYSRAMTHLSSTTPVFATSVAAASQAVESGIRATQTAEDRQNAWYNLATIAALRNDPAGVESGLRHAIASAPNWFKPHWTFSQFLELRGRHAEARQEAALALELNGGHDPEVTETSSRILSRP